MSNLALIGAGSSYTPELIDGLITHYEQLPFSEVRLQDIDPDRLATLSGLAERMLARAGLPVAVVSTTNRRTALEGADFVNCLIRVGGMAARIQDERIPVRHGLIGQETTGPGGMMKALRTIPVMLELAADIAAICPHAWLINYTNPSGIIAEALGTYGQARFVGLCSGPQGWSAAILRAMEVPPERATVDWMGLNHLGFATRVWVDGEDATSDAIEAVADHWALDGELLRTLGAIPASYLQYYYRHDELVTAARQPGYRTRGEQVSEIESALLRAYADPALDEKPALLRQRGGGGYANAAFAAMIAIAHNTGSRQIIQVPNQGALDDLPAGAAVEVPCILDHTGPHPLRMGAIPLPIRGLIQAVKTYETLTVEAAVQQSKRVALQALLAHPLAPDWTAARVLLDELLAANQAWIPWAAKA
jgi:6-phospho-beta-glucosidase